MLSPSRKGKEKAVDNDVDGFLDINPILTYRHLHAKNPGVRSPFRVVALCDSDAFYAACERVRLKLDPELPLVVQQWDALIAVSYPARKFGISRMDKIRDAKQKCPDLVVVHVATFREGDPEPGYWPNPNTLTHKVSLDHYRRESAKIIAVFKEIIPEAEIEKASIDEAFVDFSIPVRNTLLERYPILAEVPEDLDTPLPPAPAIDWGDLSAVVPVNPEADEAGPSTTPEPAPTWHDVALSIGAELMAKVRKEVLERLGYTMSAGISRNKFLAKLSASYKKPNSQSVLRNAAIPGYLRPMQFRKIRFLGGKLGKALAEEYDASTVGDLHTISLDEMQRKFGEESVWVWEVLRGIDRSEVKEKSVLNKSMLASKNLPRPVTKPSEGIHWLRVLASELALRLHEARETTPGLWPKTIVLHTRRGWQAGRSRQQAFPFSRNLTADVVSSAGEKLWRESVGTDATAPKDMKVTHIMLGFSGIAALGAGQAGIEGFFTNSNSNSTNGEPSDNQGEKCTRCGAQIKPLQELPSDVDDETREAAMVGARLEHEDWHFAKDLARQPPTSSPSPPHSSPKKRKSSSSSDAGNGKVKKRKKEPVGIAKYFAKK
ncbi:DNA/RNA polymerase [Exidia glandulosa HHB12029]|uniref:DNA polymerase eta n=1 Tax=Exidia glandulosa HHB12029 TaxID=1314781 RepID=A0A165QIV6_EXIGL|nr:DNA/RNA polymerase [Exidia glandulosa HHB12029]